MLNFLIFRSSPAHAWYAPGHAPRHAAWTAGDDGPHGTDDGSRRISDGHATPDGSHDGADGRADDGTRWHASSSHDGSDGRTRIRRPATSATMIHLVSSLKMETLRSARVFCMKISLNLFLICPNKWRCCVYWYKLKLFYFLPKVTKQYIQTRRSNQNDGTRAVFLVETQTGCSILRVEARLVENNLLLRFFSLRAWSCEG